MLWKPLRGELNRDKEGTGRVLEEGPCDLKCEGCVEISQEKAVNQGRGTKRTFYAKAKGKENHGPFRDLKVIHGGWSTKIGRSSTGRAGKRLKKRKKKAIFSLQSIQRAMKNHRRC